MKLAIISDLHSNREALEAVFADIRRRGVTDLVCLGDVIGYGPDPEFCVDLVRGHARWCLMGNHDEALFRDASDFNPHARGAIVYTRRRMQPRWWSSSEKRARWKWLKNLPLKHSEGRFLFVHGSPRKPTHEYVFPKDSLDSAKINGMFAKFDVPLSGYIINRVLPAELKDQNIPEYLKNRLVMQEHYLQVIDNRFGKEILARVPEMERDITGLDMIEKVAKGMFGDF